jgi:hypothetical protein
MTTPGDCGNPHDAHAPKADGADGAERYMWAYVEDDGVVLSIPGIRNLELSADDARVIGEMLIEQSCEAKKRATHEQ